MIFARSSWLFPGLLAAVSCMAAPAEGPGAAPVQRVQGAVQDWLGGVTGPGQSYEDTFRSGDGVSPLPAHPVAEGLFSLREGDLSIGLGFSSPPTRDSTLDDLRTTFNHVALDRVPVPGIEAVGWETRLQTPRSSFKEGVTIESWNDGVIRLRVQTEFFAASGRRTGLQVPADAAMPPGTYFQIRTPIQADLQIEGRLLRGSGPDVHRADVVIYGGTSAAVTAAVQARRMGRSVVMVSPDQHLGGLSSGGLGWTDTGNKSVIGGLSREFYQRVFTYYSQPETWKWQARSSYGNLGQGTPSMDGKERTMWIFEPHVAEQVFEDFIAEYNIPVYRNEWLDRGQGVALDRNHIRSITTLSGKTFEGAVYIDATYEGDLMATAGVRYHVGREPNATYNETWNGVQVGVLHHAHHFGDVQVSPYQTPGDPTSGVLPGVSAADPGRRGEGDHRVQAYCFRTCFTDHPENRVPFPKPEGYDPGQYELLIRIFEAGFDPMYIFGKFDRIPNLKTDTNNHGPFSFDNIGMNWDYPEASYARRREIIRQHETYQKGLLYFICTDPRVPKPLQDRMNTWGLAKDEFVDNGHWPHQLYIREARRMIGEYVTTENDVQGARTPPRSIGMGSYTMDSHNVQRYVTPEGFVQNEGDIGVRPKRPYQISYGSIIPRRDECDNLLVPVCVSSSHIAFGSIRMEPVFMILGQSAATAACLAIEDRTAVQDVDYPKLKARLVADKQRL